jgi:hypothetical protein
MRPVLQCDSAAVLVVKDLSELREEHGCVLLPLLVILAVTVTFVVLVLAHWNARYL